MSMRPPYLLTIFYFPHKIIPNRSMPVQFRMGDSTKIVSPSACCRVGAWPIPICCNSAICDGQPVFLVTLNFFDFSHGFFPCRQPRCAIDERGKSTTHFHPLRHVDAKSLTLNALPRTSRSLDIGEPSQNVSAFSISIAKFHWFCRMIRKARLVCKHWSPCIALFRYGCPFVSGTLVRLALALESVPTWFISEAVVKTSNKYKSSAHYRDLRATGGGW